MRHPFTSSWVFVFAVMGANLGCTPRSAGSGAAAPDDGQALPAVGDPQHNLLKNGTFDDGVMLPWMQSFTVPAAGAAEVKDGALCLRVDSPGANRWDAQIRHREMVVEQGHNYTLSFKAWASRPTRMTGKIGMSGPPYKDYWTRAMDLDTKPQPYGFTFSMKDPTDATVELAFHAGGQMVQGPGPAEICIDDVVLSDPAFVPPPPPAPVVIPDVRVNQQGYLPKAVKVAAWVTDVGEA
jgi:endoglucanase